MLSLIAGALGRLEALEAGSGVGDIVISVIINPVWKLFDLVIGAIQAFIFALLTILYFDTAMSGAHEATGKPVPAASAPLPEPTALS